MTCMIVRRMALVFLAALVLVPRSLAADAPSPEAIRLEAQACADAMLKGNFEAFADFTHPKLVELLGGRQKFIEAIKKGDAEMKAQKTAITGFTTRVPDGVVKGGSDLFAVVPTTLSMTIKDSKIKQDGYLLAVSSDGGTKWTFITGEDRAKLKEIL